jgi:sugar lactone lactonase YvrE
MRRWFALAVMMAVAGPLRAQDMPLATILKPGEGWRLISKEFGSVAGLAADAKGDVYVSDPTRSRVDRIDAEGRAHPFAEKLPKSVLSLSFAPDGRLFGTRADDIVVFDSAGAATAVEGPKGSYLAVNAAGGIYSSHEQKGNDPWLPGEVVYTTKEGTRRPVFLSHTGLTGMVFWPDQGTLVVADAAAPFLWTFRVEKDGTFSSKDRYYRLRHRDERFSPGTTALAMDRDSRLYAATDLGVQVFDPTGRLCGVLTKPENEPLTALAFGGADFGQLYLACGNKLYARTLQVKGYPPGGIKPPAK